MYIVAGGPIVKSLVKKEFMWLFAVFKKAGVYGI